MVGRPTGRSFVSIRANLGEKFAILTYDDGPEPEGTAKVLDVLKSYTATATFFVLMSQVREHPELLKEIKNQGHEIALHGVDHLPINTMDQEDVFVRTYEAKQRLEELIEEPVRWFRPPYGRQSSKSWQGIARSGLVPTLWNVQCDDWVDKLDDKGDLDYEKYVKSVQKIGASGAMILAHDCFDRPKSDSRPKFDRGVLAERILTILEEKEFKIKSIANSLELGEMNFETWWNPPAHLNG